MLDLGDAAERKKLSAAVVADLAAAARRGQRGVSPINAQQVASAGGALLARVRAPERPQAARLACLAIAVELYGRGVWPGRGPLNDIVEAGLAAGSGKLLMAVVHFLGPSGADGAAPGDEDGDAPRGPVGHTVPLADLHYPDRLVNEFVARCLRSEVGFEQRLAVLAVAARIIAAHALAAQKFYSYLLRLLHHKQQRVSRVLAAAVAATHAGSDPAAVGQVVGRLVADFAAPDRAPATIAMGIMGIRELVARLPGLIDKDTLKYLVEFRAMRDKGGLPITAAVSAAVRGLVNEFRRREPALLQRALRGREAAVRLVGQNNAQVGEKTHRKNKELSARNAGNAPEEDSARSADSSPAEEELSDDSDEDSGPSAESSDSEDSAQSAESSPEGEDDSASGGSDIEAIEQRLVGRRGRKPQEKQRPAGREKRKAESRLGNRQSLSNRAQARNKPMLMAVRSGRVRRKRGESVAGQAERLRRHLRGLKKGNPKKKRRRVR